MWSLDLYNCIKRSQNNIWRMYEEYFRWGDEQEQEQDRKAWVFLDSCTKKLTDKDKTWTKGRWYPWRRSTASCPNVWQLCYIVILRHATHTHHIVQGPQVVTYSDSEMRITLATLIPNSNWNLAWSGSVPPECVCNLLHLSSAQVIVYVSERCRGQVKGAGPVEPMLDVRWVFPFLPSRPNWPLGISQSLVSVIRTEVGAMTRATDEMRDESTREEGRGDTVKTQKTTEWCGLSKKRSMLSYTLHDSFWCWAKFLH